jgi:arsenite-transporting ATPase
MVTNAEKVVLRETQRAFTYFCLYGMTIDDMIVNRILPGQIEDKFFLHWKETQDRYITAIEESFAPVPIWKLSLFPDEVLGIRSLERLGRELYGDKDPAGVYFDESPYRFKKVDGNYQLRLRLPFVTKEEVELYKKFDELIVRIGNFKRHVSLPQALTGSEPQGAAVQEGNLIITFGGKYAKTHTETSAARAKR